ncbi:MAG: metallophosphoesterase [Acidimicrobiia bacterium]
MGVQDAELVHAGWDSVEIAFVSDPASAVRVAVGDREVVSTGTYHVVRVDGLEPSHEYPLRVEGAEPSEQLPSAVRTLARPRGALLARVAVVNDVHFGETVCGELGPEHDVQPVFRVEPGDAPYPEIMNAAVVADIARLGPDAVVANGDLTDHGAEADYARFLEVYRGAVGDRLHHVGGNHDVLGPGTFASAPAPYRVTLDGVVLAVADTTVAGEAGGRLTGETAEFLVALADAAPHVLVFGHHPTYDPHWDDGRERPFNLARDDTRRLVELLDHRSAALAGYFSGHTHRNLVRHTPDRGVPLVEVAAVKEYPGAWAELTVFEGGYTYVVHRVGEPAAMAWAEKTSHMIFGMHRAYARGTLADRCFSRPW